MTDDLYPGDSYPGDSYPEDLYPEDLYPDDSYPGDSYPEEPYPEEPYPDALYVDGNALAGPLAEIFAVDLTAATGRCVSCGRTGPVAELRVYDQAPGLVARCPGCAAVVLRLVRGPASAWLDLRGVVSLRIPLPPPADPQLAMAQVGVL